MGHYFLDRQTYLSIKGRLPPSKKIKSIKKNCFSLSIWCEAKFKFYFDLTYGFIEIEILKK